MFWWEEVTNCMDDYYCEKESFHVGTLLFVGKGPSENKHSAEPWGEQRMCRTTSALVHPGRMCLSVFLSRSTSLHSFSANFVQADFVDDLKYPLGALTRGDRFGELLSLSLSLSVVIP